MRPDRMQIVFVQIRTPYVFPWRQIASGNIADAIDVSALCGCRNGNSGTTGTRTGHSKRFGMKRRAKFKATNIPDLIAAGVNVQFTNGNGKTIDTNPKSIIDQRIEIQRNAILKEYGIEDVADFVNGEMESMIIYCIDPINNYEFWPFPPNIMHVTRAKIFSSDKLERLRIAAALIFAEFDREFNECATKK
jgi:hypothetical protein